MKKYIFLTVIALATVYVASNMTYAQQSIVPFIQNSLADEPFKKQLSLLELTYWGETISIETRGYAHFVEFLIRKATHFFGYGIIGGLLYLLYRKLNWRLPSILALATIFIISSLDEYNQTLHIGRTGTLEDVRLDLAGAIFIICLLKFGLALLRWQAKRSNL